MGTYNDLQISKLKLNNNSGTVCSLECYYKEGQDGKAERIGNTGTFPLGQSKTLDLSSLEKLKELEKKGREIWVTAYSNVKLGSDSSSDVWFRYASGSYNTAEYSVSGTAFDTNTSFLGLSEQFMDYNINSLKLNNQSGTVCSLECYYRVGKNGTPYRAGGTSSIPVGQSVKLNLDDIKELKDLKDVWVTAFANVSAGADCHSNVWLKYFYGSKAIGVFTITGVINFTQLGFDRIENG